MTAQPETGRRLRRFSVDDYHRMVDAGIFSEDDRVELLDGAIVEMTPIGSLHASHVSRVASLLRELEPESALIRVQSPIELGTYSEPEPDVTLVEPRTDFYRDAHPSGDDVRLVVEVGDTSVEFDRSQKLPLYADHDIPVVWLVDAGNERLQVYEDPGDGEYAVSREPLMEETLEVPVEADVSIPVGDLFV